jgi:hypothetical protein
VHTVAAKLETLGSYRLLLTPVPPSVVLFFQNDRCTIAWSIIAGNLFFRTTSDKNTGTGPTNE